MITQEQLEKVLHYCPDTGVCTWLVSGRGKRRGQEAGNILRKTNGKSYRQLCINYRMYQVHRLAFLYMLGTFPADQVDHIDGNGTNNAWDNLRVVTNRENSMNKRMPKNNTSGVVGVNWFKPKRRWRATISIGSHRKFLGSFRSKEEAIAVRKAAEVFYGYHENHGTERPL